MQRMVFILSKWHYILSPRVFTLSSKSSVTKENPASNEHQTSSFNNYEKDQMPDQIIDSKMSEGASGKSINNDKFKSQSKTNIKSKLVADVFNNLLSNDKSLKASRIDVSPTLLEVKIRAAKDVHSLLDLTSTPGINRKAALTILSILGDWASEKKVKLSDFENDVRFLKMCKMLSQDMKKAGDMGDLGTVLGVTGDDEAAKLISTASLSQMVRIFEKLTQKKTRSPPLLRSLAFNISKSDEKLDIKQCADVLFSMASLNFHDEVLLVKICGDALTGLMPTTRSAVVGSIARSIGIIRCRDTALLDKMSDWLEKNITLARSQDIVAVLMALASVNHQPYNAETLFKALQPMLRPLDFPTAGLYLDSIWAFLLLDRHTAQQIAMVLSPDFVEKLRKEAGTNLSLSTTLKLININAAAQYLVQNYEGPKLPATDMSTVPLTRSKDKTALVNCVMDSLMNLLPGENFLRRNVDSHAGFIIDGECLLDGNCTPLPVANPPDKSALRVAILVLGYRDTCVGARFHSNGIQAFSRRLLESQGFKVLTVLHSEFSPSSKLVQRVQYLENKLRALVTR